MKKKIMFALNNVLDCLIVFSILGFILKIYDTFTRTMIVSFISGILFVLILFVYQIVRNRCETKSRDNMI